MGRILRGLVPGGRRYGCASSSRAEKEGQASGSMHSKQGSTEQKVWLEIYYPNLLSTSQKAAENGEQLPKATNRERVNKLFILLDLQETIEF
jgi:hypothetical protein